MTVTRDAHGRDSHLWVLLAGLLEPTWREDSFRGRRMDELIEKLDKLTLAIDRDGYRRAECRGCSIHEGPAEDCPLHGRPYDEVWELYSKALKRINAAEMYLNRCVAKLENVDIATMRVKLRRNAETAPAEANAVPSTLDLEGVKKLAGNQPTRPDDTITEDEPESEDGFDDAAEQHADWMRETARDD